MFPPPIARDFRWDDADRAQGTLAHDPKVVSDIGALSTGGGGKGGREGARRMSTLNA
jgi:hypothetical protein